MGFFFMDLIFDWLFVWWTLFLMDSLFDGLFSWWTLCLMDSLFDGLFVECTLCWMHSLLNALFVECTLCWMHSLFDGLSIWWTLYLMDCMCDWWTDKHRILYLMDSLLNVLIVYSLFEFLIGRNLMDKHVFPLALTINPLDSISISNYSKPLLHL